IASQARNHLLPPDGALDGLKAHLLIGKIDVSDWHGPERYHRGGPTAKQRFGPRLLDQPRRTSQRRRQVVLRGMAAAASSTLARFTRLSGSTAVARRPLLALQAAGRLASFFFRAAIRELINDQRRRTTAAAVAALRDHRVSDRFARRPLHRAFTPALKDLPHDRTDCARAAGDVSARAAADPRCAARRPKLSR